MPHHQYDRLREVRISQPAARDQEPSSERTLLRYGANSPQQPDQAHGDHCIPVVAGPGWLHQAISLYVTIPNAASRFFASLTSTLATVSELPARSTFARAVTLPSVSGRK